MTKQSAQSAPPAADVAALIETSAAVTLSPSTIRDLAIWYAEEADRRRVGTLIDQPALDRDLRQRLAERGVFPEFIAAEFERVMQAVLGLIAERLCARAARFRLPN
jgi:hypothetical protein